MPKGIIKVIEAIISAIIILISLVFFITPALQQSAWGDVYLKIQGQDILFSLAKSGKVQEFIKDNNASEIGNLVTSLLVGPIGFSFSVYGIPSNVTYISCLCDDDELQRLENIINPSQFYYKGRLLEFRAERIDSLDAVDKRTNVVFVFNYTRYNDFTKENLINLINEGKNIFIVAKLDQSEIENEIFSEIFGLAYKQASANSGSFCSDSPKNVSYKVAKYFVNLSFNVDDDDNFFIQGNPHRLNVLQDVNGPYIQIDGTGKYYENDTFQIDGWNLKVYKVYYSQDSKYAYIGITDKNYEFSIDFENVKTDERSIICNDISAAKVNYGLGRFGNGRTVWISGYDDKYDDVNQLVKALLLWASGEKYEMIKTPEDVERFFTVTYLISDNNEFYQVSLNLWHIFF